MFKGFYTATAGMMAQQRRTDLLTNNMANANTPGFKADQSSLRAFPDMLVQRMDSKDIPVEKSFHVPVQQTIGSLHTGVYMQETMPNLAQGDIHETEIPTDVALVERAVPFDENGQKGALFFVVEGDNNELRYTRNGNFTIDEAGFLTTTDGRYVLNEANERIQLQSENVRINEGGIIFENEEEVARLNVAYANNLSTIAKEGNGLYRTENGQPLPSAIGNNEISYHIQQGFLERSNVDTSQTMTEMLTAYRAFEANQKIMQAYDRSMEKSVNDIGRVR
ncbi:flagellar hook-basal body protein [Metabacillus iocasae]|uniref:Flagellar basal-body rod protein FlgG n=1 Tax=Priestia iocasae TaxID=2291674 RepID=A0ABS2QX27_9BACI|nr:flagellar hook-basal body protein [Metabacillus iocasae]MBM7704023.1 flagellar basal-body rod protein FlgG [Metabacillus iocasae]